MPLAVADAVNIIDAGEPYFAPFNGLIMEIDGGLDATAGVTLLEAAEAAPVPVALVAVTENVYAVPFVRPVTVIGLAVPVAVTQPEEEVTL